MPVLRQSGKGGGVKFTWQGATVQAAMDSGVQGALDESKTSAVDYAQSIAPVRTGFYRDNIDGDVTVAGTKRTMTLRGNADYSLWIEVGTSRMPAQHVLRRAIDQEAPKLTQRIQAALGGR